MLLLLVLCLVPMAQGEVTVVVGGTDTMFLDQPSSSTVLAAVEVLGCPGGPLALPPLPRAAMAPLAAWHGGHLWVCGGATWEGASSSCYSWAPEAPEWRARAPLASPRAFGLLHSGAGGLEAVGGLDTATSSPALATEIWSEEEQRYQLLSYPLLKNFINIFKPQRFFSSSNLSFVAPCQVGPWAAHGDPPDQGARPLVPGGQGGHGLHGAGEAGATRRHLLGRWAGGGVGPHLEGPGGGGPRPRLHRHPPRHLL